MCPGAERFFIEFDSRCCTERRYAVIFKVLDFTFSSPPLPLFL